MKRVVFLYSFLLLTGSASAYNRNKPKDVVLLWNELHNTQTLYEFRDLYADNVLFYGRWKTGVECYQAKAKFLNINFSQKIISDIDLRYYSSGIIKCDFEKEVIYKDKRQTHSCYLLLKKIGNKYYITGESDIETDKNKNVSLAFLGYQKGQNKIYLFFIIIFGIGLVAYVIYYFVSKKKFKKTINMPKSITENYQVLYQKTNERTNALLSIEEEKGRLFENWIVEKFDKNYFRIIEWRSDKYSKGVYAESSKYPDLEIGMTTASHNDIFAVECKWRKDFNYNKIEWAKDHQIDKYREFEKISGKPVFVVIGVGGNPSSPESVYIVPLKKISSKYLSVNFLQNYKMNHSYNFFYDAERKILK